MKKIIVISAHPDDEVLGCGGALLRHKAHGDELYWLIVTNVLETHGFSKERVKSRQDEIDAVANKIGFKKTIKLDYPTMSLDSSNLNSLINEVSKAFNEVQPEVVYVVNRSDAHSDHRYTFDAVFACTKSFRYPFVKSVLMYECISETEFAPALNERVFQPNYFVDISKHLKGKLELMMIYESEIGSHPFPRSLKNMEALATYRGATAGVEYAEAFQTLIQIDK